MSEIKKKQHYVWRRYLKNWTNDESIWTLLLKQSTVVRSSLMGIAQKKFFYQSIELTGPEEEFLEKFIRASSPKFLINQNIQFLKRYTLLFKLKKQMNLDSGPTLKNEFEKVEKNLLEDYHCDVERNGHKIIRVQELEDLSFLDHEDDRNGTVHFICTQYCRTLKMLNNLKTAFATDNYPIEKYWPILSHIISGDMAANIALDPNLRWRLYKNQTSTPLITNDQPVVNILQDNLDSEGYSKELEFYYPISPTCAISMYFDGEKGSKYDCIDLDETMVHRFNSYMIENSELFVFANKKSQLESLKRMHCL